MKEKTNFNPTPADTGKRQLKFLVGIETGEFWEDFTKRAVQAAADAGMFDHQSPAKTEPTDSVEGDASKEI